MFAGLHNIHPHFDHQCLQKMTHFNFVLVSNQFYIYINLHIMIYLKIISIASMAAFRGFDYLIFILDVHVLFSSMDHSE